MILIITDSDARPIRCLRACTVSSYFFCEKEALGLAEPLGVVEVDGRVLGPGGDEFGLGVWPKAIEAVNKRTEKQRAKTGYFMK